MNALLIFVLVLRFALVRSPTVLVFERIESTSKGSFEYEYEYRWTEYEVESIGIRRLLPKFTDARHFCWPISLQS